MFGCSVLIALGCAGQRSDMSAPAASAGDEPPPTAAESSVQGEESLEPARGRIVVSATCEGKPVAARGRMPIERGLNVDFAMGQEFTAEAGTRHMELTLDDDTVLVDKPTLPLEVLVEPRKLTRVNAVFPWAKVQLKLLIRGNEQPPTTIKLIRKGTAVAEVETGSQILVSPGNYEADVPVRGKTARVKGLVFFESTTQLVPVRVP